MTRTLRIVWSLIATLSIAILMTAGPLASAEATPQEPPVQNPHPVGCGRYVTDVFGTRCNFRIVCWVKCYPESAVKAQFPEYEITGNADGRDCVCINTIVLTDPADPTLP